MLDCGEDDVRGQLSRAGLETVGYMYGSGVWVLCMGPVYAHKYRRF